MVGSHIACGLDGGKPGVGARTPTMEAVRGALDVPGSGKRGSVRGILLGSTVEKILTNVKDEGGNQANGHKPTRE
ncbi:MAG TPA: hypothetical protein VFO78_11085 [Candidatus Limnocylindrales bacterium]|nr:hypothetical protein [Candidatus Limnocylindrales bacterium]